MWLRWSRACLQRRRPEFDPWVGKIPWRRGWLQSSILAWRIPRTQEPGGLQAFVVTKSRTRLTTLKRFPEAVGATLTLTPGSREGPHCWAPTSLPSGLSDSEKSDDTRLLAQQTDWHQLRRAILHLLVGRNSPELVRRDNGIVMLLRCLCPLDAYGCIWV